MLDAAYAFGICENAELAGLHGQRAISLAAAERPLAAFHDNLTSIKVMLLCLAVWLSMCLPVYMSVCLSATLRYRHNQSRWSPRHCLSLLLPFSLLSSCSKVLLGSCVCFYLQLDMSSPVGVYVADQLARWGFIPEMKSFASRLKAACWDVTGKRASPIFAPCNFLILFVQEI